jgi:histidine triad (HIT) family protein
MGEGCAFCEIIEGKSKTNVVFEDTYALAFLDQRPVFHGHCLLVPKQHFETIMDTPDSMEGPLFKDVKLLSKAIKLAMKADGILIISNNLISQSVPHLHIHIIPRRKGEILKGFMWPRHPYESEEQMEKIAESIKKEAEKLKQ